MARKDTPETTSASIRIAFGRFWPYVRSDRRFVFSAIGLLVVSAAAETVAIRMFGVIADSALGDASLSGFWVPAAVWAGAAVVAGTATFGAGWLVSWIAERFLLRVRDAVYAHLQSLSPGFYAGHDTGDLTARLTSDIEQIEQLTTTGVVTTAGAAVTAVFYTVAGIWTSWQLALVALVLAPATWLASRLFSRRIQRVAGDERAANGAIATAVTDGLTHLPLVQAYNQQPGERRRLNAHGKTWLHARVRLAKLGSGHAALIDVTETIVLLLVVGAGIWLISRGRLTIGGVLAFTSYLAYLNTPLRELGYFRVTAAAASVSSDRIAELMAARPGVTDIDGARALGPSRGELVVDRVTYRYPGTNRPALSDLSFVARRGELVLLTGASGAGKSTVAQLLLRFADPDRGAVRIDGTDLRGVTLTSLREQVALIPQQAAVLHAPAWANIAYGRPGASPDEVVAAAKAADAHDFITALPQGYQTVLDGQRISGGQRQRIAIARALLRNAPIIVLDEPTTGLDSLATERVVEPLRRLARGRTLIMISHDLSLAPFANTVLVLDAGRIVERGTHDELVRAGGLYTRLHAGDSPRSPVLAARPQVAVRRPPGTHTGRWAIRGVLPDPDRTAVFRRPPA